MTAKDLANLIERTGLSQREFGLKVNLSHVTIQNYLKNKRKITEEIEKQIKVALGQSADEKLNFELHVHFDWIRLTFFDSTIEKVMKGILGIDPKYFHYEEKGLLGYDENYSCGNIKILKSPDRPEQGIMLELTGKGVAEMEEFLLEQGEFSLVDWIVLVTDPDYAKDKELYTRINYPRLDLTIDELFKRHGNYDLHDFEQRMKKDFERLIETDLKKLGNHENYERGVSLGLTIELGSRGGNFVLRMYEKAKEIARKENITFEEALEEYGIVNRYEMELKNHYAKDVIDELAVGKAINDIAINLLLSKVAVYEEVKDDEGHISYQYHQPFYDVFGSSDNVKVNNKSRKSDFESSMKHFQMQYSAFIKSMFEVYGEEWTFEWLKKIADETVLNRKRQKIVDLEKVKLKKHENGAFEWYSKHYNI